jgi:hypothetical protein
MGVCLGALSLTFATAGVQAATVKVTSLVASSSYELQSFVAAATSYDTTDLIQPTLTAYLGRGAVAAPSGDPVPAAGQRSLLMTGDFRLNSGLSNVHEAQVSFAPPLVNGPGPDLVFLDENAFGPPNVMVTANGNTITFPDTFYNTHLLAIDYHQYFRGSSGAPPVTLSELEADPYPVNTATSGGASSNISGLAIDLDDFGVGPLGAVSDVVFRRVDDALDPLLLMGIRSVPVPEPGAALLAALAFTALPRVLSAIDRSSQRWINSFNGF